MPIYEYKCDLCNGLWEEIQNFSDDPLTVCKSCEKEGGVRKLFSGQIAFHLKGGGWAGDGYDKSKKDDGVFHWDADKGMVENTLPEEIRHEQNEGATHIPMEDTVLFKKSTVIPNKEYKIEGKVVHRPGDVVRRSGDVDAGEVQLTTACQPDRQDSSSA